MGWMCCIGIELLFASVDALSLGREGGRWLVGCPCLSLLYIHIVECRTRAVQSAWLIACHQEILM